MRDSYGCACPKNKLSPRYDVEPLPFYGHVSLANFTMFKIGMFRASQRLFVGVEGFSCYTFFGPAYPEYVAEKLQVPLADARVLADFINDQLGHADAQRHGHYNPVLVMADEEHEDICGD